MYNGQPADTGSECTEPTSCTPLLLNDKDGVSVDNVPMSENHGYILRVSYGRAMKAKKLAESRLVECFVPMCHKQVTQQDKKRIAKKSLLPSFIFAYSTADVIDALLPDERINLDVVHPLLNYHYDHTACRKLHFQQQICFNSEYTRHQFTTIGESFAAYHVATNYTLKKTS